MSAPWAGKNPRTGPHAPRRAQPLPEAIASFLLRVVLLFLLARGRASSLFPEGAARRSLSTVTPAAVCIRGARVAETHFYRRVSQSELGFTEKRTFRCFGRKICCLFRRADVLPSRGTPALQGPNAANCPLFRRAGDDAPSRVYGDGLGGFTMRRRPRRLPREEVRPSPLGQPHRRPCKPSLHFAQTGATRGSRRYIRSLLAGDVCPIVYMGAHIGAPSRAVRTFAV